MASASGMWAIVISYSDRSGIIGAYGPYESNLHAEKAVKLLQSLPGVDGSGLWEILPIISMKFGRDDHGG